MGETLTADATGISDADGLDNATFTYQWLADDAEINGATASTYTLADADAGKAIKVKVTFTDDDGNDEELTSAATSAVAAAPPPPNTPATGITGTPGGRDPHRRRHRHIRHDGHNATFAYQWLADDAEINGATASTYTWPTTRADQGEGHLHRRRTARRALTSAATGAVAPPPPDTPSINVQVGETLTGHRRHS